jgi:uncharacterized membrane protein YkvI
MIFQTTQTLITAVCVLKYAFSKVGYKRVAGHGINLNIFPSMGLCGLLIIIFSL